MPALSSAVANEWAPGEGIRASAGAATVPVLSFVYGAAASNRTLSIFHEGTMNKTRALGLAAALLALPLAAQAEDKISYNYVDAAYVVVDIDGFSKDADGFALRGSVELTDSVFLFAGYADLSVNAGGFNIDEKDYSVGVGYDWSMSDTMSLYGKVAWVRAEGDALGFSVDEDGFSLGVGIRAFVLDPLELEGAVTYADLGDFGDSTTLGLAARYYFTQQFAVGVEAGLSDDATSYGVGVRFQW
jgi:hypothetical protein